MDNSDGEIIFFRIPKDESSLFVENIPLESDPEDLQQLFSPFGLLFEIKTFRLEDKPCQYAFVKYYSRKAALEAISKTNKCNLNGNVLKVGFSKPRSNKHEFPLNLDKAIELAKYPSFYFFPSVCNLHSFNYYLGFNSWSTSIISLSQESLEYDEGTTIFKSTYNCTLRMALVDGSSFDTKGKATGGGKDKSHAIEFAKKNAVSNAQKKAFQNLVLILLDNGKVAAYIQNQPQQQQQEPNQQSEFGDL